MVPCLILILLACLPARVSKALRGILRIRLRSIVQYQIPVVIWVMEALSCSMMDVATSLTEATVTLHFFVAGLPILYFLGLRAEAMKLCAGAHIRTREAHASPPVQPCMQALVSFPPTLPQASL